MKSSSSSNNNNSSDNHRDSHLIPVTSKNYIPTLLQLVWSPVFAALSLTAMTESNNSPLFPTILEGFKSSIYLLSEFAGGSVVGTTECETFVFELCRLTGLFSPHMLLRAKNIQAIKAVLSVAMAAPNNLGRSWKVILESISRLDSYF